MDNVRETKVEWKRPDEVMQLHRLKVRKRALQARMNRTAPEKPEASAEWSINVEKSGIIAGSGGSQKRKNPFATRECTKKIRPDLSNKVETSNESVLVEAIGSIDAAKTGSVNQTFSSEGILPNLDIEDTEDCKGKDYLPLDWTLKTKMRIMSPKPFAWNGTLKTSEEASGTTGFVRCLDIGEKETTLDTSPNAR